METGPYDFKTLLDPVEASRFFEVHWEKKPLHLHRTDAAFYSTLLSIADLERLIASREARYPAIQLSKNGAYFPPEVYTEDQQFGSARFTGVPDVQKIASEYRAGATIVLPGLHRTWTPIGNLCASIDAELDHVSHANAYLTPGDTVGFTPHYDTHEVFVLQIAGHKHWCIYEPPIALPHRKQTFTPVGYALPARPLLEVDLSPGDLLYLPRGYVHTTTTSVSYSAHVTIGIAVYAWLDLASEIMQSAMESPRFRKALPPGFASRAELRPALREELSRVLDDLQTATDRNALIDRFLSRISSAKSFKKPAFRSDVSVIGPDTRLCGPDPKDFRIVQHETHREKIALVFGQRRLVLPADARSAVETIQKLRTFAASTLPGPLDLEARLALVRQLHDKGFLTRST